MNTCYSLAMSALLVVMAGCKPIEDFTNSKTVLVDLDVVARELGRDATMKKEIETTEQQLRAQLEAVAADLQQQVKDAQDKLTAQSSDAEKAQAQNVAIQAQQALRNQQLAAQQKANEARTQLIEAFRGEVKRAAEPIARARGARMVRLMSADVLWFDPAVDVTHDVVAALQKAD